jgi:hypothetical protein
MLISKSFGSLSCGTVAMFDGDNLKSGFKFRHHCAIFSSSAWIPGILELRLASGDLIKETTEDLEMVSIIDREDVSFMISYQSVMILTNSEKIPPLLWTEFIDVEGVLETPASNSSSCHGNDKSTMSAIG